MSENKHTPEPWSYDGHSGIAATGSDQFNGGYFTAEVMGPDKDANARRIVACVNACAGMDDPQYEIDQLRAQLAEQAARINHAESEARLQMRHVDTCLQRIASLESGLLEAREAIEAAVSPSGRIAGLHKSIANIDKLLEK